MLEVPELSTVSDLIDLLGLPADLSRVVLVNGRDPAPGGRLAAGDVVAIYPPLAGGAGPSSLHRGPMPIFR